MKFVKLFLVFVLFLFSFGVVSASLFTNNLPSEIFSYDIDLSEFITLNDPESLESFNISFSNNQELFLEQAINIFDPNIYLTTSTTLTLAFEEEINVTENIKFANVQFEHRINPAVTSRSSEVRVRFIYEDLSDEVIIVVTGSSTFQFRNITNENNLDLNLERIQISHRVILGSGQNSEIRNINLTYGLPISPPDEFTFNTNGLINYTITAIDLDNNTQIETGSIFVNPLQRFNFIDQNSNPVSNFTFGGIFYNTSFAEFPLYDLGLGTFTLGFSKGGFNPTNVTFTFNETSLFNETINVNTIILNVSIFDRSTGLPFTNNVTINIIGLAQNTTDTGNLIFDGGNVAIGTYRIEAISEGYFTESRVFTYNAEADVNINFYLLNLTQENSASLFVQVFDEFDNIVVGANVRLKEYDPSILAFREVSQCRSNTNGECQFLIEQSTKTYIITASRVVNGVLFSASSGEGEIFLPSISGGEEILGRDIVRSLFLQFSTAQLVQDFTGFSITAPSNAESTIIFKNDSITIVEIPVSFQATNNQDFNVCVEFYLVSGGRFDEVRSPLCVSGSSGIIPLESVTLNNDFDYEIRITIEQDNNKITYRTYRFSSSETFWELMRNNLILSPVILLLWVVLLGVSLGLRSLGVWSIGSIMLAVFQMTTFTSLIFISANVIIILINLGVLYISRKQLDSV